MGLISCGNSTLILIAFYGMILGCLLRCLITFGTRPYWCMQLKANGKVVKRVCACVYAGE